MGFLTCKNCLNIVQPLYSDNLNKVRCFRNHKLVKTVQIFLFIRLKRAGQNRLNKKKPKEKGL